METKLLTIRAYCSKCHKLLLESKSLTKRELMVNWDDAVYKATMFRCDNCKTKFPNFNTDLKIYHAGLKRELSPKTVLPKPDLNIK